MAGAGKGTTTGVIDEMMREAENVWMHRQRMRYNSVSDIVELAKRPARQDLIGRYELSGGLGKTLARSTVSRRIAEVQQEHHDELTEVAGTYRALELERLEELAVTARTQIERMGAGIIQAQAEHALDIHAEKQVTASLLTLLRISERRAKLLGLDAPIQIEAEVIHHDGVAIELAAMLDAADASKAKSKKKHKIKP